MLCKVAVHGQQVPFLAAAAAGQYFLEAPASFHALLAKGTIFRS